MKNKSKKKYYSASEIREMVLKERKLPRVVGKSYTPAIFGGERKNKIILK